MNEYLYHNNMSMMFAVHLYGVWVPDVGHHNDL